VSYFADVAFSNLRVRLLAISLFLLFATMPSISTKTPSRASQTVIAEGMYVYGSASNPTKEHWILSKTAQGQYIVEGNARMHDPETEILNYRLEMDAALHPSLVELHTTMDYPSYNCKLS
jgi:hypothetical protein